MAAPSAVPVLVTRPLREAQAWVRDLQAQGWTAQALPLIDIAPAPDAAAVAAAREALASCGAHSHAQGAAGSVAAPGGHPQPASAALQALMFVSANAVQGLLAPPLEWPPSVRAWATGPGTTRALREAGVPPACIDAPAADAPQFDSEALWSLVQDRVQPARPVLIVRGGDARGQASGRDWLATRLQEAGVPVRTVVTYTRQSPRWDEAQLACARQASHDGAWWLFSSSEAIANLRRLLPGQSWSQARAACTHPRIAQAAREAGFGRVEAVPPTLEGVSAFLQSAS